MKNMKKDKDWEITPEILAKAKEVGKEIQERNEKIKTSTAECPIHKVRGKYKKLIGAYTHVRPLYRCPKGHDFFLPN